MTSNSQAGQDLFVCNLLNFKRDGFFVEIGSNDPIKINNTYKLENELNWKGIMVEYSPEYLPMYREKRPNSIHVIQDATTVDYRKILEDNLFPQNIDYLQIDLEVTNGSTLKTLEHLEQTVFDKFTFATVTFEHDIYASNYLNTRVVSREIFDRNGYLRIFPDIHNLEPKYVFEDWYVHPDLISLDRINEIIHLNKTKYVKNSLTGSSICWKDIVYS